MTLDLDPKRKAHERQLRALRGKVQVCEACHRQSKALRYLFEGDPRAPVLFLVAAPPPGSPGVAVWGTPAGIHLQTYIETLWPGGTGALLSLTACHGASPRLREIDACRPLWEGYIQLHRPKVIVALGSLAHDAVRPTVGFKVGRLCISDWKGTLLASTYHPAVLERPDGDAYRPLIQADLAFIRGQLLRDALDKGTNTAV